MFSHYENLARLNRNQDSSNNKENQDNENSLSPTFEKKQTPKGKQPYKPSSRTNIGQAITDLKTELSAHLTSLPQSFLSFFTASPERKHCEQQLELITKQKKTPLIVYSLVKSYLQLSLNPKLDGDNRLKSLIIKHCKNLVSTYNRQLHRNINTAKLVSGCVQKIKSQVLQPTKQQALLSDPLSPAQREAIYKSEESSYKTSIAKLEELQKMLKEELQTKRAPTTGLQSGL